MKYKLTRLSSNLHKEELVRTADMFFSIGSVIFNTVEVGMPLAFMFNEKQATITSLITEIVSKTDKTIIFKTENSTYMIEEQSGQIN